MADGQLGRFSCVSMALGGMIGGGIFAVLGVVAQIVHGATWFAFVLAGGVALCAGYSFNRLNRWTDAGGGSVTFVQQFTGSSTLAGMTGWTLLVGYVGSMAMYAYAFGSFAVGLNFIPDVFFGLPARPFVSVGAIAGFVGLNLLGAQSTGTAENVLVGVKLAILAAFGLGGLYYGATHDALVAGWDRVVSFGPIMAAAISFVAFQGWQLLYYDQESIRDAVDTIRSAVYIAIPVAVALYVIVAITTVSLAPMDVIRHHPERALAVAADPFIPYGILIISIAALFSTGSAINATLFSTGYFAKSMIANDLLPDRVGQSSTKGLPRRTVLLLGGVTAAFTLYGSLNAITSFASLAFIVVFGSMCVLAFRERAARDIQPAWPLIGAVGAFAFFVLMFWHLYRAERATFFAVLGIAAAVIAVELLYFERSYLVEEAAVAESWITPDDA
ncbi:APC family permease [Salisaeta longa]|uniref:APC family permease n=1 Tax=Salisaeta longa TaxID=503170 RepID=UPI0003B51A71|nr:APC family permease [Salisaeta longa]